MNNIRDDDIAYSNYLNKILNGSGEYTKEFLQKHPDIDKNDFSKWVNNEINAYINPNQEYEIGSSKGFNGEFSFNPNDEEKINNSSAFFKDLMGYAEEVYDNSSKNSTFSDNASKYYDLKHSNIVATTGEPLRDMNTTYSNYLNKILNGSGEYTKEFLQKHPDIDKNDFSKWVNNEINAYINPNQEYEIGSSKGFNGEFSFNPNDEEKINNSSAFFKDLMGYAEEVYDNSSKNSTFSDNASKYYDLKHSNIVATTGEPLRDMNTTYSNYLNKILNGSGEYTKEFLQKHPDIDKNDFSKWVNNEINAYINPNQEYEIGSSKGFNGEFSFNPNDEEKINNSSAFFKDLMGYAEEVYDNSSKNSTFSDNASKYYDLKHSNIVATTGEPLRDMNTTYSNYLNKILNGSGEYTKEFLQKHPDIDKNDFSKWVNNEINAYINPNQEYEIGSSKGFNGEFSFNPNDEEKINNSSAFFKDLMGYAEEVYDNSSKNSTFSDNASKYYDLKHSNIVATTGEPLRDMNTTYSNYLNKILNGSGEYTKEFLQKHPDIDKNDFSKWVNNEINAYINPNQEYEVGSSKGFNGEFSFNPNDVEKIMKSPDFFEHLMDYAEEVYNNSYSVAKDPLTFTASAHLYYDINHTNIEENLDFDSIELFTYNQYGDAGSIVNPGTSFTGLQQIYDSYLDKDVSEIIKSGEWRSQAETTIQNARNILNEFANFEGQFEMLDGEFGDALSENLKTTYNDLKCLKEYIEDNLPKVTELLDKLKESVEKKEKLEEQLEKLQTEIDTLVANKPPETIACTHINSDGEIEHPGGDPNSEYAKWSEEVAKLKADKFKLLQEIKVCEQNQKTYLASIKVYDDVLISYDSTSKNFNQLLQ